MRVKSVFVIDNYDSFTYNLVHYLKELDCQVTVKRNDAFNISEVKRYEYIMISPGPGLPIDSGNLLDTIKKYAPTKKIFGICLGQQAIAESFGGSLMNLDKVYHGVSTDINITTDDLLFEGLPNVFQAGRYHSWVVKTPLPSCLVATSFDSEQNLMSLRHETFNVRSVQFHPESILTPYGKKMIENWVHS
ncbi:MAG: aminodeoxychorismate/anthranilate synthase component II [Flavobacteriaceae bacterium]|nr:aminodeoxychorismate/anthranilate synthase component II [Flavobacteriaceae bacterium]